MPGTMQGNGTSGSSTSGSGWFNILTIAGAVCKSFTITNQGSVDIFWGYDLGLPGSVAPSGNPMKLPAGTSYTAPDAFSISAGQSVYIQRVGGTDATNIFVSAF